MASAEAQTASAAASASAPASQKAEPHETTLAQEMDQSPATMGTQLPNEHPLQTAWTFWYDKKLRKDEYAAIKAENPNFKWKDNVKKLGTFDSVESFWRHYVCMKRPSALQQDMNMYCFRAGEAPMWEKYRNGGVWILKLKKGSGVASKLWQDLLLGAIGEAFGEPSVVGVTLALRNKEDLLGVWNSDNSNPVVRFAIGEKLQKLLSLPTERTLIEYKFHAMSITDKSSYVNADAFVFTTGGAGGSTSGGNGGNRGRNQRGSSSRRKAGTSSTGGGRSSRPRSGKPAGAKPRRSAPAGSS